MRTRIALCLVLGAAVAVTFYQVRGLFAQHAALIGLAVAALGYSLLRAIDNLRGAARNRAPRNENEGQDQ